MATIEKNLSAQQKELVAVGASIGAGCHPCVSHHLQAGGEVGLEADQLLAAAASAERVTAEAAVHIGDHVRGALGPDVEPALLSRQEETLASLGAALGANDKTTIERHLRTALELGVSRGQLHEAIENARVVQENATRIHVREAERMLDALDARSSSAAETGCGCGAAGEPADAKEASTPDVGATTGDCGPSESKAARSGFAAMMAACCGPSDDSEAMNGPAAAFAKCRGMFEHSAAETQADSTTAATEAPAAGRGCGEEA